jgi:threonine aldolase
MIREARRHRKALGGGMRQAGIIAAGALYALEHHRERLIEDHQKAQILAAAIRQTSTLTLVPDQVDTNIVIFEVSPQWGTAADFVTYLERHGVRMLAISPTRVRAVTHLDVSFEQVEQAAILVRELAAPGKGR